MRDRRQPRRKVICLSSTLVVLLLAGILSASMLSTGAYALPRPPRARAAGTLNVADTAHLRYVKAPGSLLLEEGAATGGLPGTVKVHLTVGATVTASFTIYAHDGSITGHGSGTLHSSGLYASFGGSMTVSSGTGRYTHAYGHGGFYGAINRNTLAAPAPTTGGL